MIVEDEGELEEMSNHIFLHGRLDYREDIMTYEDNRKNKIASRKFEKREAIRKEKEAKAAEEEERRKLEPPPPFYARRFQLNFKEPIIQIGTIEEDTNAPDGIITVLSNSEELSLIVCSQPMRFETYIVDDFPDPFANDMPGVFLND